MKVYLQKIHVMYLESPNGIQGSNKTFIKLESKFDGLKGRKMYGLIFGKPPNEKYFACSSILSTDNPQKLGLKTYTIPAGYYAKDKLKNWLTNKDKISQIFNTLSQKHKVDQSRSSIEYYERLNKLILYLPIKN